MTPEQWKQVESALASPWGRVNLRVDGYDLLLQVQQKTPLHFVITPYINGSFRGEWVVKHEGAWADEARRFLPLIRRRLFRVADLRRAAKHSGRGGERVVADLRRATFECRRWSWASFAALKRHLLAHNTSIELAKETP